MVTKSVLSSLPPPPPCKTYLLLQRNGVDVLQRLKQLEPVDGFGHELNCYISKERFDYKRRSLPQSVGTNIHFLISNFCRVLNVVCFLLGNSPASEFYMPTFRNTLSVPSS